MGKFSLSNIAEELAAKSGITRDASTNFVHSLIEVIEKGLQEDGMVKIKGLGTFKLQEMSDRVSVDVNTGERITIKGYRKVAFTPDSAMKELVNRPFAHFEPTELNEGYPEEEQSVVSETLADEHDGVEQAEELGEEMVAGVETADEPQRETSEDAVELPMEDAVTVEASADAVEDEMVETAEETIPAEEGDVMENTEEELSEDSSTEEVGPAEESAEESAEENSAEENSEAISAEENAEEISAEESAEESTEENSAEENSAEENAEESVEEISAEEISAEENESSEAEAVQETSVVEETVPTEPKSTKRRGWGWVVVLLLCVTAYGTYRWLSKNSAGEEKDSLEGGVVYADMTVNPNLKEELGEEWENESEVKTSLPVDEQVALEEQESKPSVVETEAPAAKVVDPHMPEITSCEVVLTESLKAKSVKDITPNDTTDYVFDGTLVVHKLKNGETIIQLANKYYGDKRLWPYIVKYNKMKNFNSVAIGQQIQIPVLKEK
jgi:nucleoid DNA-binding protein